jgi:glycine cleavage system P protein (glycine dehydrogenase) subunit 1
MPYISNTDEDRAAMLAGIGAGSVEELFKDIPDDLRCASFDLPPGKSEIEVRRHMQKLAGKNSTHLICFLGGGFYDHFIPAALKPIVSRGEFYTAYTPYQPEISQGTLQAMYEYQSAICTLTGMDAANASLYDGGTALYEAMMMAVRSTHRKKIVVDEAVSPIYRKMLHCYTSNLNLQFAEVPASPEGAADRGRIKDELDDNTACLILQNPNFFGCVDDISDLSQAAHEKGALVVLSTYPIALGLLKPPGEMGVDIATGEGQSMGMGLSFGGPYLGFMAVREKYVRQLPGRLAGQTVDKDGRRGYVLTLQTREQHIRREKATSNICSNEALCALTAIVYLSLIGKQGLKEVAELCHMKAHYAMNRLLEIPGVKLRFSAPAFNEFTLDLPVDAGEVIGRLIEKGIAAGFPLGRYYQGMDQSMLVAFTEKRTKEEIGLLADSLETVLKP